MFTYVGSCYGCAMSKCQVNMLLMIWKFVMEWGGVNQECTCIYLKNQTMEKNKVERILARMGLNLQIYVSTFHL